MVTIIPTDSTIVDHPYAFFFSLFVLSVALGFWLGRKWHHWRVKRLHDRLETLKLELLMLAPRRANYL